MIDRSTATAGIAAAPLEPVTLREAYAECARIARSHYENFPVATMLVPRRLRPHFHAVYSYCRISDDFGDEGDPAGRAASLGAWGLQLQEAIATGTSTHPVLAALANTTSVFRIPPQLYFDLLEAFQQDQVKTRYEDEADLLSYCRFSANPVGRVVLHLLGLVTEENLALSDSICTGLQLANFCQDVRTDLGKGRIYIPLADLAACGASEEDLLQKAETPLFVEVMRRQVDRARRFLRAGMPLSRRLGM